MKNMVEKEKKSFALWKIIVICVVVTLLIAAGVFLGLARAGEIKSYREAKEYTDEILSTREAVKAYFELSVDKIEIADENKVKFEQFENAVRKNGEFMEKLNDRPVQKDEALMAKYETAMKELGEMQRVAEIEQSLMDMLGDGELSDEDLDLFAEVDSEYLKTMAADYKAYRAEVAEFNEKYADLKGKDKKELDADYAKIQQDGNELAKKYAEIDFDTIYGKSRDDILRFYATIEELNTSLIEKI